MTAGPARFFAALAAAATALTLAGSASAQCYNPCAQYTNQQRQACCEQNPNTPACDGRPCQPPPPTCAQTYAGVAEPTYGQDMQSCCTSDPSNCGSPSNSDYTVFQNTAACGGCAPPTLGDYAYGKFAPATGWQNKAIQVYVDPSLDGYKFADGVTSAGAVQDIENALDAVAPQLGLALSFTSSPLPPGTGCTIWLGDGSHGDPCTPNDNECTTEVLTDPPTNYSTKYATTWVDFQNWGAPASPTAVAADLESVARHEFGHTDGLADDFATPATGSCAGVTAMWYAYDPALAPGPFPSGDACSIASAGSGTAPGGGGGSSGGGGTATGCDTPIPNNTCSCIENASQWFWECQCPGSPGLCTGGGEQVCVGGNWVCGSASSSLGPVCTGTPPDCGPFGALAVCEADPSNPSSSTGVFACRGGACDGDTALPGCTSETCNTSLGQLECAE